MNKKIKKIIITLIIIIGALFLTSIYAREIGQLSNFSIKGHYNHRTGYLTKLKGGHYIMNLNRAPNHRRAINVRHRMVNANGEVRSQWYLTTEGDRHPCANNATEGYIYALDITRQYTWDGAEYVNGSWSPENREGEW